MSMRPRFISVGRRSIPYNVGELVGSLGNTDQEEMPDCLVQYITAIFVKLEIGAFGNREENRLICQRHEDNTRIVIDPKCNMLLFPGHEDKISFNIEEATKKACINFIEALRACLTRRADIVFGIPMLSSSEPGSEGFVQVDLYNRKGTVTLAIDKVNAYVEAFHIFDKDGTIDKAYHFKNASEPASRIFDKSERLDFSSGYPELGRGLSEGNINLGIRALNDAIYQFLDEKYNPASSKGRKALIVVIQMVAEAARFWPIEQQNVQSITATRLQVQRGIIDRDRERFTLDYSMVKNWKSCSKAIQSSHGEVAFMLPDHKNNQIMPSKKLKKKNQITVPNKIVYPHPLAADVDLALALNCSPADGSASQILPGSPADGSASQILPGSEVVWVIRLGKF